MPRLSDYGYLYADGKVLEYLYCAPRTASGPQIVLLHEGLGCCAMWREFPQQLNAATGLGVFSYSRAGYGRSSSAGLPWPLSYMHDEALKTLPAILKAAGLQDVVLVGHSDGASIAAIYAGHAKPASLRGLVLLAPHFFVEDISMESIAAARTAFATGLLREGLEKYHGINTHEAFTGWNGAWLDPGFLDWNITSYLADIKAPVLGLQGRGDQYGTGAQLDALKAGCTSLVSIQFLDDCGHSPHRDQVEVTVAAIKKFIAEIL